MRIRLAAFGLLLAIFGVWVASAPIHHARASSGASAKIALARGYTNIHGDLFSQVYVMNTDGSGRRKLTSRFLTATSPNWSPDGQKIAFGGNGDIYVMNADGSAQRRLIRTAGYDSNPAWSPDGRKIAFRGERTGYVWDIYVMNADGTARRRLTRTGFCDSPAWSPDGRWIAFSRTRGSGQRGTVEIDRMVRMEVASGRLRGALELGAAPRGLRTGAGSPSPAGAITRARTSTS